MDVSIQLEQFFLFFQESFDFDPKSRHLGKKTAENQTVRVLHFQSLSVRRTTRIPPSPKRQAHCCKTVTGVTENQAVLLRVELLFLVFECKRDN